MQTIQIGHPIFKAMGEPRLLRLPAGAGDGTGRQVEAQYAIQAGQTLEKIALHLSEAAAEADGRAGRAIRRKAVDKPGGGPVRVVPIPGGGLPAQRQALEVTPGRRKGPNGGPAGLPAPFGDNRSFIISHRVFRFMKFHRLSM